jgi:hypothetical protein
MFFFQGTMKEIESLLKNYGLRATEKRPKISTENQLNVLHKWF